MFKFKNMKRNGASLLKKYGYVEIGQFQPNVMHDMSVGNVKGYFCANCQFFRKQDGVLYDAVCTKLQDAEVAPWGCCNLWVYTPQEAATEEKPVAQPEQPTPEPPKKPVVQKPVQQKPIAQKPVQPVAKPVVQKPQPQVQQNPVKKVQEEDTHIDEKVDRLRDQIRKAVKETLSELLHGKSAK